jgi:hypothetical protein
MTEAALDISAEEARQLLWERGELSWKLRVEQKLLKRLLDDAPTDLAVFNISRRFGKSTTCALFSVEQALKKRQRILYCTAFRTDLENFITPIFEWVLSDCPEHLRPVFNASKKEYQFPNGSVIRLVGLDKNANALRGNNIDICIIDEAAFVTKLEYIYRSVIVPATMKRKFKLIFPSTPPESPEHFWAKELVEKAKEKGTYIHLTIDDISDLPASERKRLLDEVGGEQSATAQREFFGRMIVDVSRAVAPSFIASAHVRDVDPQHVKWGLFGDTGGVRDLTVFLKAGWCHVLGKKVFRDELVFPPGTPTSEIVAAVKAKWPGLSLTLDASGQLLIDYSAAGLPAMLPQKDEFNASLLLLNTSLHNEEVLIHPDCRLLIRTLEGGLLNRTRTDYERTEALGHCDAAAAFIYALRGIDRLTDLRPAPNPFHYWAPDEKASQKKALRKLFQ